MDNKKVIGQRINSALAAANKKQKELAAALGVTDNTISYFVSGKRTPNTEQIIKIAEFLNVSADYLLGLSDVQSTDIDTQAICKKIGCSEEVVSSLISLYQELAFDNNAMVELINDFFVYEGWAAFFTNLDDVIIARTLIPSLKEEVKKARQAFSDVVTFEISEDEPFITIEENGIKRCVVGNLSEDDHFLKMTKALNKVDEEENLVDAILWRTQSQFRNLIDFLLEKHTTEEVKGRSIKHEIHRFLYEVKRHANPNEQ